MSDTFASTTGRRVVSRASAEVLGPATHLVVDSPPHRIRAVVVGKGRKARLVDWEHVSGVGPDAIMVVDEGALREAADDRERAALGGKLELVGTRALSELGNELGTIDDVVFDPATGLLEQVVVGEQELPAHVLLGAGSYAAVLARVTDSSGGAP